MNQLHLFRDPPALAWCGCQLAEKFSPEKVRWPVWCEEKIDGVRALIVVDEAGRGTAYSRAGNRLPAAQVIADGIALAMGPGHVVDAELFAGSWSRTISAVKRRNPAGLTLHAFDALTLAEWQAGRSDAPLEARRGRLEALRGLPGVEIVGSVLIRDSQELDREFRAAIGRGWEGLVLKRPGSPYTCGARGPSWCKMKPGEGAP